MPPGFDAVTFRAACAAALLWLSSGAMAAMTITSPTSSLQAGDSFVATVAIDSFVGIESVDIEFQFDPAVLTLDDALLAPGVPAPDIPFGVGPNKVGFGYLDALTSGGGALVQATFTVAGTALNAVSVRALVTLGEDLPVATAPLTIAVTPVPEPATAWLLAGGLALLGAGVHRARPRLLGGAGVRRARRREAR